ncbi:hypothetical protein [Stenotrophomonas maltophilia]|nr:hypothetical protein [Stenotrophomonas maltophilia]
MYKLTALLLAVMTSTASAEDGAFSFSERVEAIASSDALKSAERHGRIVELYQVEFGDRVLARQVDTLRLQMEGALTAAFYSKDRGIAREAAIVHRALATQGALRETDTERVIASLIKAREFDWANALALEYGRPTLPPVKWEPGSDLKREPKLIVVDDGTLKIGIPDGRRLRSGVVVVGNPLCGFSSAAGVAIANDPSLRVAFDGSLWLVPPEGQLHVREVKQWNIDHAGQQMALAYDWLEWPEIDEWSTPTFYFFADGKLVDKVIGWPLDGSRKPRLRQAVKAWREAAGEP